MCRTRVARSSRRSLPVLIRFSVVFLFFSCAAIEKRPVEKPLSDQEVAAVIATMRKQQGLVTSLAASGKLSIRNWYWGAETDVLLVGTRSPFRVKIEIAHSWGQPILHILIHEGRLKVLSFRDKKLFVSPFTSRALSRFFPGDLDPLLIWTVLRGYPALRAYDRVLSEKAHQIRLLNREERDIEVIDLSPSSYLPRRVSFPNRQIVLEFSEFQGQGGISYAAKVDINPLEGGRKLTLRTNRMVPNKSIPDDVFTLHLPPTFQIQRLEEVQPE
jgi:hypothetical protein